MTIEGEIKQFGIQRGAKLVGIASVADINKYAPQGHRPDDILIGAKSVIVCAGFPYTHGAVRCPDYQAFQSNYDFVRIRGGITLALAKFIESEYGYYALADVPPPVGLYPSLSFKLCGEMAGLGTRSMAGGIILNNELGFINLAVCVTTMPLEADGPLGEPVCPDSSCVERWEKQRTVPCLETCPECLSGEFENGEIKWMRFDRRICSTRPQNHSPVAFARLLLEASEEPNPGMRRSMILGSFSRNTIQAIASGAVVGQCGECVRNCPIVMRGRQLASNHVRSQSGS
jgi:hypothetical protein